MSERVNKTKGKRWCIWKIASERCETWPFVEIWEESWTYWGWWRNPPEKKKRIEYVVDGFDLIGVVGHKIIHRDIKKRRRHYPID